MKKEEKSFDYESIKEKTLAQLGTGKSLFGKDWAFAPLLKDILEAALSAGLEALLSEQTECLNRKNGYNNKRLKTSEGTIELSTPRDRNGYIEP